MAVTEAVTRPRASLGWRVAGALLRRREASILVVAVGLTVFFWAKNSVFLDGDNFKNITESMAPIALVGLVNGLITTMLRVPSFITTLGMLFFLNGVTLHLTAGSQQFMPGGHAFQNTFGSQPGSYKLYLNSEFFWVVGLVLLVQGILTWTRWGLWTFATGGNLLGAAESGVNVRAIKIGNFVLANVLAGFAGIIDSTRITTIVPLQGGPDLMFLAVAGAVIGGTSLFGGVGTVMGSFIGVAVLIILRTGLNIIGVSAFTFDLITGLAILASMIANVQVARLRNLGRLQ